MVKVLGTGKVVLVTGASSGIGAAIADRLATEGYRVFGTGRQATGRRPSGVELVPLDVRSDASVASCVETVTREAGRIDTLVNNAGYLLSGAIRVAMVEPGAIRTPLYAQPRASALAAYSPWRERALKTMKGFEEKAPGPELVAKAVSRLVASERPPLRTRLTREASLFPLLRWLLPAGAFESGLRAGFNLDKEGF